VTLQAHQALGSAEVTFFPGDLQLEADPFHEFFLAEGLLDVVVGTSFQAASNGVLGALGRNHHNGQNLRRISLPENLQQLHSSDVRHHDIQQDQ